MRKRIDVDLSVFSVSDYHNVDRWCAENCMHEWSSSWWCWSFTSDDDAAMFILRWSDLIDREEEK